MKVPQCKLGSNTQGKQEDLFSSNLWKIVLVSEALIPLMIK